MINDFNFESLTENTKFRKEKYIVLFYSTLSNILGNVFNFTGFNEIDKIDLKRCFFYSHYVGYSVENDRVFITPLAPNGNQNTYNEYTTFTSIIPTEKEKIFSVYSNENIVGYSRTFRSLTDAEICNIYAERLAEMLISIDNSIVATRIINIFFGSENTIFDKLTEIQNLNIGNPFMIKKKNNDMSDPHAMRLADANIIKDYYDGFREIINEFMIVSGLSSIYAPNKKERLITGEIATTDDIKSTILFDKFECRKAFLEKINSIYNTDYDVELNIDTTFID